MRLRRFFAFATGLCLLIGACATQESPKPSATASDISSAAAIQLDKAVHFSAPDGSDAVAPPGTYRVDQTEETKLKLVPAGEGEQKPAIIVQAMATQYEESLAGSLALSIPYKEDEHHVILLLPEGKALDAVGSYSGLRSRAMTVLGQPFVKQYAQVQPIYPKLVAVEELPSGYTVRKIAQANLDTGRKIHSFYLGSLNNLGHAVYVVYYDDTGPGQRSILLYDGGTRTLASNAEVPVYYESHPLITDTGMVVFKTWATNAPTTIWRWVSGQPLTKVVGTGTDTGYTVVDGHSLNNSGSIAYYWSRPLTSSSPQNSGISVWKDGASQILVDESRFGFAGQHFIGRPAINDGGDVVFWTARKSNWLDKGVHLLRGGTLTTVATPGSLKLPHQLAQLPFDKVGRVWMPVTTAGSSVQIDHIEQFDGQKLVRFPITTSGLSYVGLPEVSASGTVAFFGQTSGLVRQGIFRGGNADTDFIIRKGDRLDGRTVSFVILHDVNDRGSVLVEARFDESGQYGTLFRVDPLTLRTR